MKRMHGTLTLALVCALGAGCEATTPRTTPTPDAAADSSALDVQDTAGADAAADTLAPDAADVQTVDAAKPDVADVAQADAAADAGADAAPVDAKEDVGQLDAAGDTAADVLGFDAVADVQAADIGMDAAEDVGMDMAEPGDISDVGTLDAGPDVAQDIGGEVSTTPNCTDYCALIQQNCTADLAQYTSVSDCTSYCSIAGKIPVGTLADKAGDTLGCRTYHAGLAAQNPVTHCPHAGRSGGNVCGSWCEVYCDLAMANCTGDNTLYADINECMAGCAGLPTSGPSTDKSGDTVQCRITHLGYAGVDAPAATIHCPHGKIMAAVGSPCGPAVAPAAKTWAVATTANFTFDPPFLFIRAGDSVTFTVGGFHTATQVEQATWNANGETPMGGGFNVGPSSSQTVQFPVLGTVYYVCIYHVGGGMKGKIFVQ